MTVDVATATGVMSTMITDAADDEQLLVPTARYSIHNERSCQEA